MPRKLEAQFDGRYLMSSVLMTSTMKSEPAGPPMRLRSFCGVPGSAARVHAGGGSAEEFLRKGVKALVPLRMQEIADEVGVHISTVSRAVSGKYAQTPRGIFALKYFFTGGTKKETGGVESQAAIKQRIREMVDGEDHQNPLSDDQIAALLEERDSIRIARRTVTKYRKALSIPSSGQRRQF